MPRQFYTDKERYLIFSRVSEARKQGRPWAEVHVYAKDAGFRGGVPALQIFVKKAKKKTRKARVAEAQAFASVKPTSTNNKLESAIDRLVQKQVRAALEKAIDTLKSAM